MNYKKHTLKNGLRVLFVPMKDAQTVTVLALTGTGSRYETRKTNGLAHFLEHMFFKGTKKRPTAMDISHELDAVGGAYNAYTGKDRTGYWAKVDAKHAMTALDVVSDIFLNAKIEQKEINKERGPILQEINMYEDMPMRRVGEIFEQLMYGDHPLGWDIAGPKQNIHDLMREDFLEYLRTNYVTTNTAICVAGNFSEKKILAKITKDFAKMSTAPRPSYKPFVNSQKAPALHVQNKKTDQTQLFVGVRSYGADHKDRYVVSVIAAILGGGMSSRLFSEVREKRGLAYFVRAFTERYPEEGYLGVQAGVEHENLDAALTVILSELKKLRRTRVSAKELKKVKEFMKGSLVMGLETTDDIATYIVEQEVIKDEVILPHTAMKNIDRVSAADVQRVAKDIITNKGLNCAIIGPHKAGTARIKKLLKF